VTNRLMATTTLTGVHDWNRGLMAESAVDGVLSDSFPASDPPSWTSTLTRPNPTPQAESDVLLLVSSDGRTWVQHLASLAAAAGVALLTPVFIVGTSGCTCLARGPRGHRMARGLAETTRQIGFL
jgi:hypothetical protein